MDNTQDRLWYTGDVQERSIAGITYTFRCIDPDYMDAAKRRGALFLCDEVIGGDQSVYDTKNNNWGSSGLRLWLNNNLENAENLMDTVTTVRYSYSGSTTSYEAALNRFTKAAVRTGDSVDKLFCLSLEEAIRYQDSLWKLHGADHNNYVHAASSSEARRIPETIDTDREEGHGGELGEEQPAEETVKNEVTNTEGTEEEEPETEEPETEEPKAKEPEDEEEEPQEEIGTATPSEAVPKEEEVQNGRELMEATPSNALKMTGDLRGGIEMSDHFDGEGTEKEPYQLRNDKDLKLLAYQVANEEVDGYDGCCFELTKDISLNDSASWLPIGYYRSLSDSEPYPFKGTVEGNGYRVYNLKISDTSQSYAGLFGYTYGAVIRNLTVDGQVNAADKAALLVGEANDTVITECKTLGQVRAVGVLGGIAGEAYDSMISDCKNTGSILGGTDISGSLEAYAGGICGSAHSTSSALKTAGLFVGVIEGGNVELGDHLEYLYTNSEDKYALNPFGNKLTPQIRLEHHIGAYYSNNRDFSLYQMGSFVKQTSCFFYEELEEGVLAIGDNNIHHFAASKTGDPVRGYAVSVPSIDYGTLSVMESQNNYAKEINWANPGAIAAGTKVLVYTSPTNDTESNPPVYYELEPGSLTWVSDDSGKHEDINSETADIFFTMPDENITVSAKYRAMTNGVILSQDNLTFEVEQIRSGSRWNPQIAWKITDPQHLTATVIPDSAANKNVVWNVKDTDGSSTDVISVDNKGGSHRKPGDKVDSGSDKSRCDEPGTLPFQTNYDGREKLCFGHGDDRGRSETGQLSGNGKLQDNR